MTGPKYHKPRDENLPIVWLSRRGGGCSIAVSEIADILIEHAAVLVAVSDVGEVYAIDPAGTLADKVERLQPGWIVGVYTADSTRAMILADLQARASELRSAVA